ncbi:hypothetical protein B296_00050734 [Ensete ventricosum]|uniref:CRM domain-containing protein n=1 Tax=Ensete ventricosum TaxID=4639 RepID=A0A426YJU3_ENSVE|nr:hypothetical protein B296_00050734 [Ensete ventricosum]
MGDSLVAEDTSVKEAYVEVPFKAAPLSNRERLILRKQALKMKKRPVLAVGRNNVISGVAKTIRTHFMKYHLAIVNIKGRAKGTSVQELIFELEVFATRSRQARMRVAQHNMKQATKSVGTLCTLTVELRHKPPAVCCDLYVLVFSHVLGFGARVLALCASWEMVEDSLSSEMMMMVKLRSPVGLMM